MAGEVIVDALPYIDQGYDETGVREAALALVDEETKRYRTAKNYLDHLPPLNLTSFETELMRSEWERMQQRQPMDILSMKRYELPPPPAGKMTDLAAWTECVENSMAQLEHQATRICNLELMLEYGCEAWKSYLEILEASVSLAQKKLHALRRDIQDINWQRKSNQLNAGERLRELEATWVGLVSKNYDIEQACAQLEEEIVLERQHREHSSRKRRIEDDSSSKRSKAKAPRQEPEWHPETQPEIQPETQPERESETEQEREPDEELEDDEEKSDNEVQQSEDINGV